MVRLISFFLGSVLVAQVGALHLTCTEKKIDKRHVYLIKKHLHQIEGEFQSQCGDTVFEAKPEILENICIKKQYGVVNESTNGLPYVAFLGSVVTDTKCNFGKSVKFDEFANKGSYGVIWDFIGLINSNGKEGIYSKVSFWDRFFNDEIRKFFDTEIKINGTMGIIRKSPFNDQEYFLNIKGDNSQWAINFSVIQDRIEIISINPTELM